MTKSFKQDIGTSLAELEFFEWILLCAVSKREHDTFSIHKDSLAALVTFPARLTVVQEPFRLQLYLGWHLLLIHRLPDGIGYNRIVQDGNGNIHRLRNGFLVDLFSCGAIGGAGGGAAGQRQQCECKDFLSHNETILFFIAHLVNPAVPIDPIFL